MPSNSTDLPLTSKSIASHASPAHPSTLVFPTASIRHQLQRKNSSHLRCCTTPNLLLWRCNQPPLAFLRSRMHTMRDSCGWTVQIGPEEGKQSRFCLWKCTKTSHLTLTYISQTPWPSVVVQQVSHCTNIVVLFANHFSYYVFIFHMVAWYWWWAEGVVLRIASFWRWRLVEGVVCCRVSSLDWENSDSTG